MRIVKILIALIFFQMLPRETISQSGELTILQTNNGSTIDVSLYIKRTGAVEWNMGYASFVVNYNFSAMNLPVKLAKASGTTTLTHFMMIRQLRSTTATEALL